MNLREILELEARLSADRQRPEEALWRRDRDIVADWPEAFVANEDRRAWTRAWLRQLPEDERVDLAPWLRALRLSRAALVIVGALVGAGLAGGLLRYDGTHPINVLPWLALMVVVPALGSLLGAVALVMLGRGRSAARATRAFSLPMQRLFLWLSARLSNAPTRDVIATMKRRLQRQSEPQNDTTENGQQESNEGVGERKTSWRSALNTYQQQRSAYQTLEARLAFSAAQLFSIALSVSALVVLVARVVSSDLAFGWSTTLALEPHTLLSFTDVVAAPFAWLAEGRPDAALVEATRYVRMERGYVASAASSTTSGPWWTFMFWSALCWGLLPRLALLTLNEGLRATYQRRLPPRTPDVDALLHRLRTPLVTFTASRPDPGDDSPLPRADERVVALPAEAREALVFRWRDAATSHAEIAGILAGRHGLAAGSAYPAGGLNFEDEDAGIDALRERDPLEPVAIFVESWETPDRAFLRLIERIRRNGTRRPILVFGSPGASVDGNLWRDYLGQLHDPYLSFRMTDERFADK